MEKQPQQCKHAKTLQMESVKRLKIENLMLYGFFKHDNFVVVVVVSKDATSKNKGLIAKQSQRSRVLEHGVVIFMITALRAQA